MNITRHNCEAVFLDYYEKNLSPVEVAEVLFFLEENPDLKEVFESYEVICLEHEKINFPDKEALKKKYSREEIEAILSSDITPANCEQFFIANCEGILSSSQKEKIHLFLLQYPEWKKEFELFQQCRLSSECFSFEHKELLKKEPVTAGNKEEYFIRAIEKDLNEAEQKQLASFLKKNPEYKKEFDLFARTILPAEKGSFGGKEALKKVLITKENCEEYFIRSAENDLNRVEEEQLRAFLQTNPQYKKEIQLFAHTILPVETISFDEKESLKKRERKPVFASIFSQRTMYYAAAAVILLLIGMFFYFGNDGSTDKQMVADKTNPVNKTKEIAAQESNKSSPSQENIKHQTSNTQHNRAPKSASEAKQKNILNPNPVLSEVPEEKNLIALEVPKLEMIIGEDPALADSKKKEEEQKNEDAAIAQSTAATSTSSASGDGYITLGAFIGKKVRQAAGIKNTNTCGEEEKLGWWDLAVLAKQGIQKLTGTQSIDMNKNCGGAGEKAEYVFTAGNFEISGSGTK